MSYFPAVFFAKGTILLLYLRLFSVRQGVRYAVYAGLAWTFLLYWTGIPIATYYCVPRMGDVWDIQAVGERCAKMTLYLMIVSVLAVILDFYILILPISTIMGLHLSLNRRLSVLGVFGTAFL